MRVAQMAPVFDDITFRYGRRTPVFSGFSLTVAAPATVLLGPNGAGKSTLMGLAASQLTPTDGALSFNRLRPEGRKQAAYRKSVAHLVEELSPTVQVLVSTHQTEDLAALYAQVIVLDQGTVRFHGSPAEFQALAPEATGDRERAETAYARLVGQEI
ncbi:ABC transporter ATP-binding protein [Streptomyces sp. NPDC002138]|uniref:ABC transporter ATP-binding protein n=1 Tax=Streptomyces sp. NPDC002138 TaxID=3154410 RepID=UPI003319F5B0